MNFVNKVRIIDRKIPIDDRKFLKKSEIKEFSMSRKGFLHLNFQIQWNKVFLNDR